MKDASLIVAAVKQLSAKDDAHWEPDGAPKLELIQKLMNDTTVTVDDVQEAIGAFKRGDKKFVAQTPKDPAEDAAAAAAAVTPAEASAAVVPPLESLDPDGPEYADRVVRNARAEDAELKAAIDDCERQREGLNDKIRALTVERDKRIVLIEAYSPRISHAQAVKAIQAQTRATLADTTKRMVIAQQVFGPGGTPKSYASKLDAAFAMRKRSPAETANFAKFVHQQAQAITPVG